MTATYRVNDGAENYYIEADHHDQAADLIFAYEDYDWGEYSGGGRYTVWEQDADGNDVGEPVHGDLSDFR